MLDSKKHQFYRVPSFINIPLISPYRLKTVYIFYFVYTRVPAHR